MVNEGLRLDFKGTADDFALDIAFEMPGTGITALFGASGSGKTTILRAIAGLHQLEGTLLVAGHLWQNSAENIFLPPHKRPIGYVFQEASLFPHLTVRQNLHYGLKRAEKAGAVPVMQMDDIISLMNIERLLDRSPHTLSGGERQRVAVGRALLRNPRLLLMDEPLSALDQKSREELLACLEGLHRALDVPMLYVSHDFAEVARLADHMVLIKEGKKQAEGPARALFERLDFEPPAGRFETSVVLSAKISEQNISRHLTYLTVGKQTVSTPKIEGGVGCDVMLRVRARDVALATKRPEAISIRNIMSGTISDVSLEEGSAFVEVQIDIGDGYLRSQVTHDAFLELGLGVGVPVFALVKSMSFGGISAQ